MRDFIKNVQVFYLRNWKIRIMSNSNTYQAAIDVFHAAIDYEQAGNNKVSSELH